MKPLFKTGGLLFFSVMLLSSYKPRTGTTAPAVQLQDTVLEITLFSDTSFDKVIYTVRNDSLLVSCDSLFTRGPALKRAYALNQDAIKALEQMLASTDTIGSAVNGLFDKRHPRFYIKTKYKGKTLEADIDNCYRESSFKFIDWINTQVDEPYKIHYNKAALVRNEKPCELIISIPQGSGLAFVDYEHYVVCGDSLFLYSSSCFMPAIREKAYLLKASAVKKLNKLLEHNYALGHHSAGLMQMGWPRFMISTDYKGTYLHGFIANCYREGIYNYVDWLNSNYAEGTVIRYNKKELIKLEKQYEERYR